MEPNPLGDAAEATGAPSSVDPPSSPALDDEVIAFSHRVFDMARDGDAATLTDLLQGGLPPNLTNDSGDTLLILGAYYGRTDVVRALLAHGADVSRVNDRGQTAIAAAVFKQDAASVTALLDAGADPAAGRQSALATAEVFELPAMAALLQRP